ncbi:protein arginine methyltransferase NDUFAF7, mitochondrial-like [Panonychus citri]|uniref:protein arginine methyltransferase NDUFAF7, mitochondrial-like n=1 Tax=Panonychus citri TaxID=50023 RepID=UPI002306F3DA|nr:protein arginine methyltransferase NDUFAF7, mitochondrial-like [Panonychus citri]
MFKSVQRLNPLHRQIIQRINFNGPLTIADYMKLVLTCPSSGFYMKQDVFGRSGHFITSPEISQIFGELIAVWFINEWQRFNSSRPLRIVELGPGRGTLASDISRVLNQFSFVRDQASLHLVEISPHLVQIQEQHLCGNVSVLGKDNFTRHDSQTKLGLPITWYRSLDQVPEAPGFTVYIAHEFLDALPIHKFQKNEAGEWREVLVDINANEELRYVLSRHPTPASKLLITQNHHDLNLDHLEICPEAALVVENISKRLNNNDGCALICDYGYDENDTKSRDTFRAFRDHNQWDPLKEPGSADLTADVDFGYLKRHVADQSHFYGPIDQKSFLENLGIGVRLAMLLKTADEKQKEDLVSGVRMILDDMGPRFKFMSMFPRYSKHLFKTDPPGFSSVYKSPI